MKWGFYNFEDIKIFSGRHQLLGKFASQNTFDTKLSNFHALFEWFSGIFLATSSNIFKELGHMSEKMEMKLLEKTASLYLLPFMR